MSTRARDRDGGRFRCSNGPPSFRNPAVNEEQVLTESARRVRGAGVFEQGAGALELIEAFQLLSRYTPRASFLPPSLDLTDPYMWPFSRQVPPALPLLANFLAHVFFCDFRLHRVCVASFSILWTDHDLYDLFLLDDVLSR